MTKLTPEKINFLDALIQGAGSVAIVTHTHPDGDAVGSSCALLHYLEDVRGRNATVILPDGAPDNLGFLSDGGNVILASDDPATAESLISAADLIFCLDMNTLMRCGVLEEAVKASGARKVLIDHHLGPESQCFDLVFSETEISSASELLYYILLAMQSTAGASALPARTVEALMTGMTTDTNNFANSVFPSTLAMASGLLDAGADRDSILDRLYNSFGENRFRAMGAVLSDLMTITPDGVAFFVMDKAFLDKYSIREGDTDRFVNLPLGIKDVRFSVFLKEDKGLFRVSIRSKKGWSANRFARDWFHGGGHECASGGRLYFPADIPSPADAVAYVENAAARFMRGDPRSKN